jgi:hypothetical protein
MPKVINTRKQKAAELLERLESGPSFSDVAVPFTTDEAAMHYRVWSSSWIIPIVKELVPELKEKKS